MELKWTSFEKAKAASNEMRRYLLLGNGFSVSKHQSFAYARLYDEALRNDASLAPLFEGHGGDFEAALSAAASVEDQTRIRRGLVAAIGRVHPARRFLSPEDCESCGRFLESFAGPSRDAWRGRVFTTNYDLFLYWVLMQRQTALKLYDGFDNYGVWHDGLLRVTSVFYLHGALHHYERDIGRVRPEMQQYKLLWQEGLPLPRQVRHHIAQGHFPVFVSEGTAPEKEEAIRGNPYLHGVNQRFRRHCREAGAAVFTVGHSLGEVDRHITDMIGAAQGPVFVGVYNDRDVSRAKAVAHDWAASRRVQRQPALQVALFDVRECPIWASP